MNGLSLRHGERSTGAGLQSLSALFRARSGLLVWVWAATLLLCTLTWWLTFALITHEKAEFDAGVDRSLTNLTRLAAEHASRTLHSADSTLKYLQLWYFADSPMRPSLAQLAAHGVFDMSIYSQVGVIGRNGWLLASSSPVTAPVDLSDREHFKVHVAQDDGRMFISRPVVGRASGKASIQLSRRINLPDGRFGGVAVVSISADYFNAFYGSLHLGPNDVATLAGMDGFIRARRAFTAAPDNLNLSDSPAMQAIASGTAEGSFRFKAIADGTERLYHFREVADYPMWVSVGLGQTDLLADLRNRRHVDLLSAAYVNLLLLGLASMLTWHQLVDARNRESLRAKHAMLVNLTDQVPGELFQFRIYPDGRAGFPFASRHFLDFYGVSQEQIAHDTEPVFRFQHPADRELIASSIAAATQSLSPWQLEYRLLLPDGATVWRSGRAMPERMADGSVLWHGAIMDITDKKLAEDDLRIAATAFQSNEAMAITGPEGHIERVNPSYLAMFGYSMEEVVGRNPNMMSSGRHDAKFYQQMWHDLTTRRSWAGEIWNRRKDGEIFPDWLHITAVVDGSGTVVHYVATHTDLTARKKLEDEIRQMAFLDPLTQLPNRRLLQDRLEQACLASSRSGHRVALAFLDLDRFKELNDTLGHDHGDLLLQQVAMRLRQCVREGDTVARLAGDEFVIVLANLSTHRANAQAQARTIGEKVVHAVADPFDLKGTRYTCTCSVGIAMFEPQGLPAKYLIRAADRAMYEAKRLGRNQLVLADAVPGFEPSHPGNLG